MNIYSEPEMIAISMKAVRAWAMKLAEKVPSLDGVDWGKTEFADRLTESEDGSCLLQGEEVIAEYSTDDYYVTQWEDPVEPGGYLGFLYFKTHVPGSYVRVYFHDSIGKGENHDRDH